MSRKKSGIGRGMTFAARRAIAGRLFLLPWIIGFVYFFLVPFIQGIVYTLNKLSLRQTGWFWISSGSPITKS